MVENVFSNDDLEQMSAHGVAPEEARRQLEIFKTARPYLKLAGPCVPGNGIAVFDAEEIERLIRLYETEGPQHSCIKFVPASGAASRMFKVLLAYLNQSREINRHQILKEADAGNSNARQLLEFMDGLQRFAFFEDLTRALAEKGLNMEEQIGKGCFQDILRLLLKEEGLDYAGLPKGLLLFHKYPEENRTSFEEHLVEAADYARNDAQKCHLHFTVSPEHQARFEECLRKVKPVFEKRYGVTYDITFSTQKSATDTLAVDLENKPFRQENGRILFRPGGHGALLENLNDLKGDIIFIKNIDNVTPDYLKAETSKWKKITAGYLISIQKRMADFMKHLSTQSPQPRILEEALSFMEKELLMPLPNAVRRKGPKAIRDHMVERFNRPVRVCGMVKNTGEPGGGPFWVEGETGEKTRQIVETAQIDPHDPAQQDILAASTHFNPVDLVCGVRNWRGEPFDLRRYVDPKTVFISQKSKDGKDLKALEHPGLWNGSMAHWTTLFVEVPAITFNPVKTVNDLLRNTHQPPKTGIAAH